VKADVEEALKSGVSKQPAAKRAAPQIILDGAFGEYEDVTNSNIRKIIAERLSFSKQNIPHYYVTVNVNVDNLLKLRGKLNNSGAKAKISVNDMVIKAASLAAVRVPETNSEWRGDTVRQYKNVNMSVAVQTDHGLIVPVVTAANLKGLEEIALEVKDLAARARENKLKPDEMQGGTFTISNLGMFGVHNFSAIINPPQACILAVSAAQKTVVVDEHSKDPSSPYK
jgi:pyruvate dehydrogenase E2 component (dihydrolipoamide acetyltransferase)